MHTEAEPRRVAEAEFLAMTGSAGDAIVGRQAHVVEEDAPERGAGVRDWVPGRRIVREGDRPRRRAEPLAWNRCVGL